jgi:hypothetical protein
VKYRGRAAFEHNLTFLETLRFPVVNFGMSCPVFQNRDGQLIFKFHMEQNKLGVYQIILSLKYTCVVRFSDHYTKPQNSDSLRWPKVGRSSVEAQYVWHHSIDKKNSFIHVEFEVMFVNSFARKSMFNKRDIFYGGRSVPFSNVGVQKCMPSFLGSSA